MTDSMAAVSPLRCHVIDDMSLRNLSPANVVERCLNKLKDARRLAT